VSSCAATSRWCFRQLLSSIRAFLSSSRSRSAQRRTPCRREGEGRCSRAARSCRAANPSLFADLYPHQLSGVTASSVNIARALVASAAGQSSTRRSRRSTSRRAQVPISCSALLKERLALQPTSHQHDLNVVQVTDRGPRDGDVSRPRGRDRPGRGAVTRAAPSLHRPCSPRAPRWIRAAASRRRRLTRRPAKPESSRPSCCRCPPRARSPNGLRPGSSPSSRGIGRRSTLWTTPLRPIIWRPAKPRGRLGHSAPGRRGVARPWPHALTKACLRPLR